MTKKLILFYRRYYAFNEHWTPNKRTNRKKNSITFLLMIFDKFSISKNLLFNSEGYRFLRWNFCFGISNYDRQIKLEFQNSKSINLILLSNLFDQICVDRANKSVRWHSIHMQSHKKWSIFFWLWKNEFQQLFGCISKLTIKWIMPIFTQLSMAINLDLNNFYCLFCNINDELQKDQSIKFPLILDKSLAILCVAYTQAE